MSVGICLFLLYVVSSQQHHDWSFQVNFRDLPCNTLQMWMVRVRVRAAVGLSKRTPGMLSHSIKVGREWMTWPSMETTWNPCALIPLLWETPAQDLAKVAGRTVTIYIKNIEEFWSHQWSVTLIVNGVNSNSFLLLATWKQWDETNHGASFATQIATTYFCAFSRHITLRRMFLFPAIV